LIRQKEVAAAERLSSHHDDGDKDEDDGPSDALKSNSLMILAD
jgi:hypothetical protein